LRYCGTLQDTAGYCGERLLGCEERVLRGSWWWWCCRSKGSCNTTEALPPWWWLLHRKKLGRPGTNSALPCSDPSLTIPHRPAHTAPFGWSGPPRVCRSCLSTPTAHAAQLDLPCAGCCRPQSALRLPGGQPAAAPLEAVRHAIQAARLWPEAQPRSNSAGRQDSIAHIHYISSAYCLTQLVDALCQDVTLVVSS
jgi:hypothetical protein